jgi:hypothetical protein
MRGIDHPSIVKLYAFSESAEYYYLILERQSSSLESTFNLLNSSEISDGGWRIIPPDCQSDIF